jgi:hypothetical protein
MMKIPQQTEDSGGIDVFSKSVIPDALLFDRIRAPIESGLEILEIGGIRESTGR